MLTTALKKNGGQTAVFTNKHGPSARQVCAHLKIDGLLDGIFGAFDTPYLKPEQPFTNYVFAQLKADPKTALLIGDSPYDIQTAKAGGFPCWCVPTGTHSAEELRSAGADAVYLNLARGRQGPSGWVSRNGRSLQPQPLAGLGDVAEDHDLFLAFAFRDGGAHQFKAAGQAKIRIRGRHDRPP